MINVALGQINQASEEWLNYALQLGCSGVIIHMPDIPSEGMIWAYEDLRTLRETVEAKGLRLYAVENTRWDMYEDIMINGPKRDQQIETYCQTIRNLGHAGIDVLGFCWMPNSVWSTHFDAPRRGDSKARYFDLSQHLDAPLTHGRVIDEEEMWANFSYFIKATAPVAQESGVRLALHPDDPPVESLGGVARIFRNFEGFKKATEEICPNPAFGLNFCMGSWSEMGPGIALEAMKYFAERDRIAYVHFRDVKGYVPKFEECFLGEGNIDPAEAIRILVDANFTGFMQDDHVPQMQDDPPTLGKRGRALPTGYINGLLRGMNADGR